VATALALLVFYRAECLRVIRGFFSSLKHRQVQTANERLAWLLIIATIPAGATGLLFEHFLRSVFAKPLAAAIFLVVNGLILIFGERLRKRAPERGDYSLGTTTTRLRSLRFRDGFAIGLAQVLSLFAGISRSGITMVGGLLRGLDRQDAARFSFLLATPIILGAGVYKLPDLLGPNGNGIRPQVLVGSVAAALAAYVSVRFLDKYFRNRTLMPFAVYCLVFGAFMILKIH
jgi:undecaprenyl-diphosphatase